MAQTQTQSSQAKILEELRPKRKEGKESKYLPNPELFNKEKTYLVKGAEHKAPADWRKFIIQGKEVILFDGKAILEDDYKLIEAEGKEAVAFFVAPDKKAKSKDGE